MITIEITGSEALHQEDGWRESLDDVKLTVSIVPLLQGLMLSFAIDAVMLCVILN